LSSWDWSWLTSWVSSVMFLGEAIVSCGGVVRGGGLIRSIVKTKGWSTGADRGGDYRLAEQIYEEE
jgi:hypothetical protein